MENCDSIVLWDVTILYEVFNSELIEACDSAELELSYGILKIFSDTVIVDTIPSEPGQDFPGSNGGCENIITYTVKIFARDSANFETIACEFFESPSGQIYTQSAKFTETITTKNGCDSVINFNITILEPTFATIFPEVCGSYTVPSGDETYTTSGVYNDTIRNHYGCDSIITISLTVNDAKTTTVDVNVCAEFTFPSGNQTVTESGSYQDNLLSSKGCDSIVTYNVTIQQTRVEIDVTTCNSYTVPSTANTYTVSGTYIDTSFAANADGCDSIYTINLKLNYDATFNINVSTCESSYLYLMV